MKGADMGENRTSGESDRIDVGRRWALALLGLWGPVAYVAPVLLNLSAAHADEGGDGGGGGDGGSGGSGDHDDEDDSGDDEAVVPPEAP